MQHQVKSQSVKSHERSKSGVERNHELLNKSVVDEAGDTAVDVADAIEDVAAELL